MICNQDAGIIDMTASSLLTLIYHDKAHHNRATMAVGQMRWICFQYIATSSHKLSRGKRKDMSGSTMIQQSNGQSHCTAERDL